MNPRPTPHRKPDLLLATVLLVATLLPPTMALQLRAVEEGTEAVIEAAPVLVEILPGEDSPAASDGAAPPVARHLGGGIERHL
jgi:hypothetical protein